MDTSVDRNARLTLVLTTFASVTRRWLSAAHVPRSRHWQRRALRALRSLFTPLLPDDYLELINPLWSTQELRGRIERIERETRRRRDRR